MKEKRKAQYVVYPLITASIFAVDQLLKYKARKDLAPGGSREKGILLQRNSHNEGAAMNLLQKHPAFVRGLALGYTVTLSILYGLTLGLSGSRLLKAGLSILLGGAYSNTYDRMKDHYVTDYFSLNVGPAFLRRIAFNIADFAIAVGAALSVTAIP